MILVCRALFCAVMLAFPASAEPPRILALGGAVTETAFALGAGPALVGVDQTSIYPAVATLLPKVGYVRTLSGEGLLSLRPTLVLASADAGPPAALQQVGAAKVSVVSLPEAHTPDAALERVRLVGDALSHPTEAAAMMAAMRADLAQVAEDIAAVERRPRVLFLLSAGRGAPMAAGTATAAEAMLKLAGAFNAVQGFSGYRPLSAETVLLAAPDVVLTTTQTLDAAGGVPGIQAAMPGLDGHVPVLAFEGLYLLGFGPRLAQAQRDLAMALHPTAAIRPLPPRPWAG